MSIVFLKLCFEQLILYLHRQALTSINALGVGGNLFHFGMTCKLGTSNVQNLSKNDCKTGEKRRRIGNTATKQKTSTNKWKYLIGHFRCVFKHPPCLFDRLEKSVVYTQNMHTLVV